MNYWPLLLILLAVAMALGPIMMMQPSSRDRYLARVRQQAAQQGIRVRMDNYIPGNNIGDKRPVAVYMKSVNLDDDSSSWQLLRRQYQHDIHFYKEWDWQQKTALTPLSQQQLQQLLAELPGDIVGVEYHRKMVGIWWLEKDSGITLPMIEAWLDKLSRVALQA